jgi:hypothetical protein
MVVYGAYIHEIIVGTCSTTWANFLGHDRKLLQGEKEKENNDHPIVGQFSLQMLHPYMSG